MRHLIPFLLSLLALAVSAQEIAVSDPTFETARGSALVVPNGDGFLAAWSGSGGGVYASTLDLEGTLRRTSVAIAPLAIGPRSLAAGTEGSLVAFTEGTKLYTTFIDRDGNPGERTEVAESATFSQATAAGSGSGFLLLLQGGEMMTAYTFDTHGRRTGGPFDAGKTNGIALLSGDRTGYVIFQSRFDEQVIVARRIAANGDAGPWNTLASNQGLPRMSAFFDGTRHVLLHEYEHTLVRTPVSVDAKPLAGVAAVPVDMNLAVGVPVGPRTLILLKENGGGRLLLLDENGQPLANDQLTSPVPYTATLAAVGMRALVANLDPNFAVGRIANTITTEIHLGPRIELGRAAGNQLIHDVASNGRLLFVVWRDAATGALMGARIDPVTHAHLDGAGVQIAPEFLESAAVTASGDGFLVAYLRINSGISNVVFRRVSADGRLIGDGPTTVSFSSLPLTPRLAGDGTNALLVWTEDGFSVHATRISPNGTILDSPSLVVSDGDPQVSMFPDVAFNGENFLVVWQNQFTVSPPPYFRPSTTIRGSAARVLPAGVVLDAPIHFGTMQRPRVAANGTRFGVAGGAQFATVDAAGNVVSTADTPTYLSNSLYDAGADRDGFLFAWTQGIDRQSILAVRVRDDVVSHSFNPIPSTLSALGPVLTRFGNTTVLGYARATADEGFGGAMRGYVLLLDDSRHRALSH